MAKKAKLKLKPLKLKYYDFTDMWDALKLELKKDLHNYAGTKYSGKKDDAPYQNFWHYMLEYWDNFSRGAPQHINWGELLAWAVERTTTNPDQAWAVEIATKGVELFGDKDYTVIYDW